MFFPFHPGFVLCSPSDLALGSFSVKSQTDITAKLQRCWNSDIDKLRADVSQ